MNDLAEALVDLRYFVAMDRLEQAKVYVHDYSGPYAGEIEVCMEYGNAIPCTLQNEALVLIGLIFQKPDLVAQLPFCTDTNFQNELGPIVEMFHDRGYL